MWLFYKKLNDLDVIFSIKVDDLRVMLLLNLYLVVQYVQFELVSLFVDLCFINYYMDFEFDFSLLSFLLGSLEGGLEFLNMVFLNIQLFIDGICVFGYRLFGLLFMELIYFCNWDVFVGVLQGECMGEFVYVFVKSGLVFGFMFDDVENVFVLYLFLVFDDIIFIVLEVQFIKFWFYVDEGVFFLLLDIIIVNSNDWV